MTFTEDEVTTKHTLNGKFGWAWELKLSAEKREEIAKARGMRGDQFADLVTFIIEAPWAHPAWHSYALMLIHLRQLEGATHEVFLYAMNPDERRQEVLDSGNLAKALLHPANFAGQFIAESDEAAKEKVKQAAQDVLDGKLSPDTDYIRFWAHRFSDSNLKPGAGETKLVILDPETGEPVDQIVIAPHPGPQDMN